MTEEQGQIIADGYKFLSADIRMLYDKIRATMWVIVYLIVTQMVFALSVAYLAYKVNS